MICQLWCDSRKIKPQWRQIIYCIEADKLFAAKNNNFLLQIPPKRKETNSLHGFYMISRNCNPYSNRLRRVLDIQNIPQPITIKDCTTTDARKVPQWRQWQQVAKRFFTRLTCFLNTRADHSNISLYRNGLLTFYGKNGLNLKRHPITDRKPKVFEEKWFQDGFKIAIFLK